MTRQELKKKKIGVLLGGLSGEREVSLRTGAAVLKALEAEGYEAVAIDAGRDLAARLIEESVEVAFIALHGRYGEDGSVQGMLELMGIPYTGSGVLASSVAMDKVTTKKVLLYHELPTPAFETYCRGEDLQVLVGKCRHYPLVVKPAREGSTIGVVLDGQPLPIIQVVPKGGFYDYHAKYTAGQTEYVLPAPLDGVLYQRLQQVAVETCRVLDCSGAARVDFMVREREFYCLEVNTIPGMTETSLLPKAAGHEGISFAELVQRILETAGLNK